LPVQPFKGEKVLLDYSSIKALKQSVENNKEDLKVKSAEYAAQITE